MVERQDRSSQNFNSLCLPELLALFNNNSLRHTIIFVDLPTRQAEEFLQDRDGDGVTLLVLVSFYKVPFCARLVHVISKISLHGTLLRLSEKETRW